jgi:hypothetical protein
MVTAMGIPPLLADCVAKFGSLKVESCIPFPYREISNRELLL